MKHELGEEFKLEKEDFQDEDICFQDEDIWTFRSYILPDGFLQYLGIKFRRDDGSEIKYGWNDEFTGIIDYRGEPQGSVTGSMNKGFVWKICDGLFRDSIINYLTDKNYKKYMEKFKEKLDFFLKKLNEERQEWKKMGYNTEYIDGLITDIFEYIYHPSFIIRFMKELIECNQVVESDEYNKKLNITEEDYQIPPGDDICEGINELLESYEQKIKECEEKI